VALRFKQDAGFTLVEMILVIVVLSILAVGTTRYIVTSTQSFVVSAERAKLIGTARVAVEQVIRRLRNALPHSVRISASGHCIEYFPIDVGSSTTTPVLPLETSLVTSPFTLNSGGNHYAVIGAFTSSELYVLALPSPGVIAATTLNIANTYRAIPLARVGGHTFTRTSPTQRVYLVSNPERFCVMDNGDLVQYTDYGIDDEPIDDSVPDTTGTTTVTTLMVEDINVSASSFAYTPGTLVRNAGVQVNLEVSRAGESVTLNNEVQIRNVP